MGLNPRRLNGHLTSLVEPVQPPKYAVYVMITNKQNSRPDALQGAFVSLFGAMSLTLPFYQIAALRIQMSADTSGI